MMKLIITAIIAFLSFQYVNFQIETEEKSIQGFIEYLKNKYYKK